MQVSFQSGKQKLYTVQHNENIDACKIIVLAHM